MQNIRVRQKRSIHDVQNFHWAREGVAQWYLKTNLHGKQHRVSVLRDFKMRELELARQVKRIAQKSNVGSGYPVASEQVFHEIGTANL